MFIRIKFIFLAYYNPLSEVWGHIWKQLYYVYTQMHTLQPLGVARVKLQGSTFLSCYNIYSITPWVCPLATMSLKTYTHRKEKSTVHSFRKLPGELYRSLGVNESCYGESMEVEFH